MAQPLNNLFETWTVAGVPGTSNGTCTNWTAYSENGGTFTRYTATFFRTYNAEIRSSSAAPINSIGGCISDAFTLSNKYITFFHQSPNVNVAITFYLLDASDNVLITQSITPQTAWTQEIIDVSIYIGQNVKVKFTQHTTSAGAGYTTYLDNVNASNILSHYPPDFSATYVKATTNAGSGHLPHFGVHPGTSLIGAWDNNDWQATSATNQRFHIDLGLAKIINKIYYENLHNSGASTNVGVKNFTLWGSNTAGDFADLTYANNGTWVAITGVSQSTFDQHTAANTPDPKYIIVTNNTAYRYYAFKFADNWGGSGYMGFRRVELQQSELPTQKTILSDAKIKVVDNQQTITSDALITSKISKTILSDAKIKVVDLQENLSSDAKIVIQSQENLLSDSEITNSIRKNITSDARILISVAEKVNTDFRTRIEAESLANLFLVTQFGAKISCDFRTRKDTDSKISTDLRFTLYDPSLISLHPLARTDFHVYVDDVQLGDSDLKLDSIKIVHSADNKSNAEFVLLRKHDDLNNPTTITANNVVKIYLKTKLEFTGRIVTLDTNSEEESVNVKCETDDITEDYNIVTKELPLTVLNTQIHLYDILINDVSIENYYPSTKLVIVGEGKYWTGTAWATRLSQALTFDDFVTAQDYIELRIKNYLEQYESEHGLSFNIPAGHLYTYTDFDYYIHKDIDDIFLKKFPTVENYEQSPQYYKGIIIDLGEEIRQQINITYVSHSTGHTAEKIEEGTFKFLPNYTYFWRANVNWFDWEGGYRPSGWQYIGTSLGSLSTDLYEITGADYRYQRIFDDYLLGLGFYTLGVAPFKSISLKNGKKITRPKWVDKEDGLYYEEDSGYDYESYDKQIAALEYDKLKNINGDISPITNANLDLTIDGYLYYTLKLLTRINISNTTTVNIYKNNNGFPISIKQIMIDSSTMKVNLVCDNQKSTYELELIDGTYPDEPEESGEFSQKYYPKFDLSNWETVDD